MNQNPSERTLRFGGFVSFEFANGCLQVNEGFYCIMSKKKEDRFWPKFLFFGFFNLKV